MAGVVPIASGTITLDGQNLANLPPDAVRRAGIAAILEGHQVLTALTVEENLRVAGAVLAGAELEAQLGEAFAVFPELRELRNRLAGTLRWPAANARRCSALMARPKFILG